MKGTILRRICLAILLATVLLLPACSGPHTPSDTTGSPAEEAMLDIPLIEYPIVRSEDAHKELISAVASFKATLDEKFSTEFTLTTDWVKRGEEIDPNNAKEILIGTTNRPQSNEIQAKIEGAGYAIALTGNKIVITASDDRILTSALDAFVELYISTADGEIIRMPEAFCYLSEPLESVEILKNGKALYTLVRPEETSTYLLSRFDQLRDEIESETGVKFDVSSDWIKRGTSPDSSTYEILVGDTNRVETTEVKASLAPYEFAVRVVGNKIVLVGASASGTSMAIDAFIDLIKDTSASTDGAAADLALYANAGRTGVTNKKWITDVPRFTGGTLHGVLDCNSDTYEAYYIETTREAFDEYCETFEQDGFTLYDKNEISGNVFRTYTKASKTIVHTYFVAHQNAVRVIVSPYTNGLPPLEAAAGKKVTEPSITQMILDYETGAFGMCYIVTLEDGSFIIFDGGRDSSAYDAQRLHETLQSLHKGSGKPVIAAWILTHVHGDHYSNFHAFAQKYGSQYIMEYAIQNPPSKSFADNPLGYEHYFDNGKYLTTLSYFDGSPKTVKVHTGMRVNLHGAEFEILYSHEDFYPNIVEKFNDTCLAMRMTLAGQTVMWMGDVELKGSAIIAEMYGDYVNSDILQVSHHGIKNGGTKELYKLIDADVALWPCSQEQFNSRHTGNTPASYLYSSLNVREHIVADKENCTLILPYIP